METTTQRRGSPSGASGIILNVKMTELSQSFGLLKHLKDGQLYVRIMTTIQKETWTLNNATAMGEHQTDVNISKRYLYSDILAALCTTVKRWKHPKMPINR